jgi:3-hydroxyisobutyrate dehydrogenase/putative dehydrogenase
MSNVGWIGLGAMGAPMAACLARAAHTVRAYDIDPGAATALERDGVIPVASAADAAEDVDALVVMVATADQVEQVLFATGVADALTSGSVVMMMATVGPSAVEGWAERLAARGVDLVDAPVSGGVARAAVGDLLVMVSGTARAVAIVEPLLDVMARTAPVVGDLPGDGQKVKLVNQLLCGVHIAAAGEALAFAETLGVEARAAWEVVRHGAAASFMLDDRGSRMIHHHEEPVRSALDIFVKDMGLVVEAARERGYSAPLATTAEQLYLAGRRAGLGRQDDSIIIEVFRGRTTPTDG